MRSFHGFTGSIFLLLLLAGHVTAADWIAEKHGITREDQDRYAAESYRRALAAIAEGRFKDEIVPVTIKQRKGDDIVFDTDEHPKATTAEALAGLRIGQPQQLGRDVGPHDVRPACLQSGEQAGRWHHGSVLEHAVLAVCSSAVVVLGLVVGVLELVVERRM